MSHVRSLRKGMVLITKNKPRVEKNPKTEQICTYIGESTSRMGDATG